MDGGFCLFVRCMESAVVYLSFKYDNIFQQSGREGNINLWPGGDDGWLNLSRFFSLLPSHFCLIFTAFVSKSKEENNPVFFLRLLLWRVKI